MTCFEAGHRLFLSLGPSDIVMAGRDKRVALVAAVTDFMSNVNTKSVSATPALTTRNKCYF